MNVEKALEALAEILSQRYGTEVKVEAEGGRKSEAA